MSHEPRAAQTRDATARPPIGGEARGRLEIDISGLPDDMEACWIREMILGQRDDNNVSNALNVQGYEVVPPSMLPGAVYRGLPGDSADVAPQVIRREGHVLMMRPKHWGDAERTEHADEVQRQKNAAVRVPDAPGASIDNKNFKEVASVVDERSGVRPRGFKE
jgi:hypothetical protein